MALDARLQPYAEALIDAGTTWLGVPVYIISGYRSAEHNRAVGGAPRSLHLLGLAFDVRVSDLSRDQVPSWVWVGLGRYWESLGGRWGGRFTTPDVNHFDVG